MESDGEIESNGAFAHSNGIDIYFQASGEGVPLLLLHGGTTNGDSWTPQISTFAEHFHVYALDSRGHGRTKNPTGKLSYRLMAEDVAGFVASLGLGRPLVCGYSDGGQIALEMAIHHPGLASAYIVGAATIKWTDAYFEFLPEFGIEAPGVVNFARLERDHPERVEQLKREHDTFQGEGYWKELLVQLSGMWLTPLDYSEQDLAKIAEPTMILIGDRDDVALPVEEAARLYRMIPKAELAILPGADHFLPWTKTNLFTQLALEFLLRVSPKC